MRRILVLALALSLAVPVSAVGPSPTAAGVASPSASPPAPVDAAPVADGPSTAGSSATVGVDNGTLPATTVQTGPNETVWLTLPGAVVRNRTRPAPDLGGALAISDDDLRSTFVVERARGRLLAATSQREQERIAQDALDAIERRIDDLRARETAAVRAYYEGDATQRDLLRTVSRVNTEATDLRNAIAALQFLLTRPPRSFEKRAEALEGELDAFNGPVGDRVAQAVRIEAGTTGPTVDVRVSTDGYTISLVEDGRYYRQAARFDNRDLATPTRVQGIEDAVDRVGTLYPWLDTDQDITNVRRFPDRKLFRVDLNHPYGTMVVYLDDGTANVSREVQSFSLSRLQEHRAANVADGGVRLVVNRTFADGPVAVSVRNTATGDPVDAQVSIEGETVGRTGTDGRVWGLEPGRPYRVTAVVGGRMINATVTGPIAST